MAAPVHDARQCRDSSLVASTRDCPSTPRNQALFAALPAAPARLFQGAKHSPGYDRLRIARRAQCRAAMTPDVFFGTAYVISMIAYGVLTYLSIFHNFP